MLLWSKISQVPSLKKTTCSCSTIETITRLNSCMPLNLNWLVLIRFEFYLDSVLYMVEMVSF